MVGQFWRGNGWFTLCTKFTFKGTSSTNHLCASSANHFASAYLISSNSVTPRQSYDFISIFQDGGHSHKTTSGCGFNDGTRLRRSKSYQILMRYLNPRLSYYYFRFQKTDDRHIGIPLPVCNLIIYVTLACCPL